MIFERVVDVLMVQRNRQIILLALAYVASLSSIVGFVFGDRIGGPSKVQISLVVIPTFVIWYLCLSMATTR